MNGYQVAKRIREDQHGRGMLLLALTGYGFPGDAHRSSEHGFDYHLAKPVDPDHLVRLLIEGAGGAHPGSQISP
jgi:two-component system, chemotaxis family, CheB/CheR fusion protein